MINSPLPMRKLILFIAAFFITFNSLQATEVNWELLQDALKKENGPKTIESTLEWIKKNHPENLAAFALMKNSVSIQKSSPQYPRAIAYGSSARFVFTFNGNPGDDGYDRIEAVQFRETSWEFRDIRFDQTGKEAPIISEANPAKCMQCHYSRPIWEAYETWPGAYGKFDDSIIDFKNERYTGLNTQDSRVKEQQEEYDNYNEFRNVAKTHERYKWLEFKTGVEREDIYPYAPSVKYMDYTRRPNLKLTELFAGLHAKRIAHWSMSKSEDSKVTVPAIISEIFECEKTTFSLTSPFPTAPWNRLGTPQSKSKAGVLSSLLGIEHYDFSLSSNPETWQYFAGKLTLGEYLGKELYTSLGKVYSTLPEFEKISSYGDREVYPGAKDPNSASMKTIHDACAALKSLIKVEEIQKMRPIPLPYSAAVKVCTSCHGDAGPGPMIPFTELVKAPEYIPSIRARISKDVGLESMPPNRPISEKERLSILEYLDTLL